MDDVVGGSAGRLAGGGASETARRVAAVRAGCVRPVLDGGDPGPDDALAADVAGALAGTVDRTRPMARYLTARTAFFDRVVVAAVTAGVAQVVVAAAGYDGRAWRYGRAGTRWFEVDHPSTQRDKLQRIRRLGLPSDAATYVSADFATDDVAGALEAAGHRSDRSTLFLAEGIAVYLDPEVLAALLSVLRRRATTDARLAISLSVDTGDRALAERRRSFERSVARLGESARNFLTPDEASDLLTSVGWHELATGVDAAADDRRARARLGGLVLLRAGDVGAQRR